MSAVPRSLQSIREEIDEIDLQLLQLFNRRAACADEVGLAKRADNQPIYDPGRESALITHLLANNSGPLDAGAVKLLFRGLLGVCRARQLILKVAYLGPEGTFTQDAALGYFGDAVSSTPESSIADVLRALMAGRVEYGVVPFENSSKGGVIRQTLDLLMDEPQLQVCGEILLPIQHNLLSQGTSLADIKTVYAHSNALVQCERWLADHLPGAVLKPVQSNALAANCVDSAASAAIASSRAATIYNLHTLASSIQDSAQNTTRFWVVGRADMPSLPRAGVAYKTSLLICPKRNQPGALFSLLQPLNERNIDMTHIQSLPAQGRWQYFFYIDMDGHYLDDQLQDALLEIEQYTDSCRVLGSYPKDSDTSFSAT